MTTDSTLYDRLGGGDAIGEVTAEFYDRVLADPLLAPYFDGIDMTKLAGMQAAFLSIAFGGPDSYRGRDLRAAHAGMGLGDAHFDRVVNILARVLREAGAAVGDITEVATVAETTRADVLGR